jgi:hypothetical protein
VILPWKRLGVGVGAGFGTDGFIVLSLLVMELGVDVISFSPLRTRWYSVVSVCVLPPPNCVMSVITGEVFSVFLAIRRITIPECSRNSRVKQFRLINCAGSR